jgi:hypothetical protein
VAGAGEARQGRSAEGVEGPGEHWTTEGEVVEARWRMAVAGEAARATKEVAAEVVRWKRVAEAEAERSRTATEAALVLSWVDSGASSEAGECWEAEEEARSRLEPWEATGVGRCETCPSGVVQGVRAPGKGGPEGHSVGH